MSDKLKFRYALAFVLDIIMLITFFILAVTINRWFALGFAVALSDLLIMRPKARQRIEFTQIMEDAVKDSVDKAVDIVKEELKAVKVTLNYSTLLQDSVVDFVKDAQEMGVNIHVFIDSGIEPDPDVLAKININNTALLYQNISQLKDAFMHIDNNFSLAADIQNNTNVIPVLCTTPQWQTVCAALLNEKLQELLEKRMQEHLETIEE